MLKKCWVEILLLFCMGVILIGIPVFIVKSVKDIKDTAKKECGGVIKCLGKGIGTVSKELSEGIDSVN